MSREGAPPAKVVDLRRWREEKGKAGPVAPPPEPEPPRLGRLLRALAVLAGVALLGLSFYLGSILWQVDEEEGRGCALAVLVPVSGVAVFALHLVVWGLLGRPWARDFWRRVFLRLLPGRRRPQGEPPAVPRHPRGRRDGRSPDS